MSTFPSCRTLNALNWCTALRDLRALTLIAHKTRFRGDSSLRVTCHVSADPASGVVHDMSVILGGIKRIMQHAINTGGRDRNDLICAFRLVGRWRILACFCSNASVIVIFLGEFPSMSGLSICCLGKGFEVITRHLNLKGHAVLFQLHSQLNYSPSLICLIRCYLKIILKTTSGWNMKFIYTYIYIYAKHGLNTALTHKLWNCCNPRL
jgi:hypothetical protein